MSFQALLINKLGIMSFPNKSKFKISELTSMVCNFWILIFDLFLGRNMKDDQFSDNINDYLNKYIFYFQSYIKTELEENRMDFSKLKNLPKKDLIVKSKDYCEKNSSSTKSICSKRRLRIERTNWTWDRRSGEEGSRPSSTRFSKERTPSSSISTSTASL